MPVVVGVSDAVIAIRSVCADDGDGTAPPNKSAAAAMATSRRARGIGHLGDHRQGHRGRGCRAARRNQHASRSRYRRRSYPLAAQARLEQFEPTISSSADGYSTVTFVKSWYQLWAGWNPLTLADIARGFRSWTMKAQAASSTAMACACEIDSACCSGSKLSCARFNRSCNFGSVNLPQFVPVGAKLFLLKYRALTDGSAK